MVNIISTDFRSTFPVFILLGGLTFFPKSIRVLAVSIKVSFKTIPKCVCITFCVVFELLLTNTPYLYPVLEIEVKWTVGVWVD